jgi:hypothetical protein
MPGIRRILATFAAGAFLCALSLHAQDEPSLGDAARQSRLQKQKKDADAGKDASASPPTKNALGKSAAIKDAAANDPLLKSADTPKAKKIITNDEIPEHIGPTRTLPPKPTPAGYTPPPEYNGNPPAEYWKSQIQAMKNYLASLQTQISELENSIQYASPNCVSNCVQWNEQQLQKQGQLESMKQQLEQQQKSLEEFQDTARKQGFGSSVYDP